jgi:predicted ATPase/class 3 adenylate cyclase
MKVEHFFAFGLNWGKHRRWNGSFCIVARTRGDGDEEKKQELDFHDINTPEIEIFEGHLYRNLKNPVTTHLSSSYFSRRTGQDSAWDYEYTNPMPPVTIHRLVPDFILQQFRAGVRRGEFIGVGMFVDISGFSRMTDTLMAHGQHGAEVLATVMRAVFTPLIQTVHEHEGFIATLAGDAFTALFPFERAMDAGPVCAEAIQAAWEIQQQMAANAVQITPYGTYHITAKMGVAVGEAAWGIVMSEDDSQAAYYFRGAAVEDCAEVEHAASAGEIILDALVCQQAPAYAQVETHGDYFRLTGIGAADGPDTDSFLERGTMTLPTERGRVYPGETARFFPESLVTQEHTGEFRQVVNLFIQMPTIRMDIELEIFMRALFSLQNRYGGLLNRVDFGDKGAHLLMFWGAPVAFRNDIGRALNFVLELQTRTSLPFTAGLTYQISHAGFIGSILREEYTCYGRGVNLAARFMMAAPRGGVWVDEEIARRVGDYFELEALGVKTFKGFSEPQPVYQLIERKEQTASSFQGAFVGRQEELEQLVEFVRPVAEGHFAGALVISGEAGIGKSRLVSAFQTSPYVRDMQPSPLWALCQNDQILHESLNPFRYWLRQYFEQSALQGEARNKRNFSRKLDELARVTKDVSLVNELERTRSFLGVLLDLHWPDSLYEQLEGQARFDNTLIGLATLLQAESLRQPVILLIEDAQWLDADSRTFIPRLVRTLTAGGSAVPLAILAAVRLESGSQAKSELLGQGVEYQELVLRALGQGDLETQAAAVLGAPADEGLVKLIVTRAEGNPFFAEQILRYLLENHDLTQGEDGRFGVRRSLLESKTVRMYPSALPTDVRALLVARLDQLTRVLRDLVQAASVLGREFEVRVLIGMLRDDEGEWIHPGVEEGVKSGEEAGIWSAISQLRYLFRHALLRDAAYRMQVRTRLRTLHRLAVEALELLYFESLAPRYGELGYHAEQAGLTDKARDYLHKAGDAAKDAYQNSEAVDYYTRALTLIPTEEMPKQYEILFCREEVFHQLGYRALQIEDLSALRTLAISLSDGQKEAEAAWKQARYYEAVGEYAACIETAQTSAALALKIGNKTLAAKSFIEWGTALWWQGNYEETEVQAKQALMMFEQTQDEKGKGDAFYLLGELATKTGNYPGAQAYYENVLKIDQQLGNLGRQAYTLNSLGILMNHQQEYGTARRYFEQSLEIYNKIGNQKGLGMVLNNLGTVDHFLGQYPQARRAYTQALRLSRETGVRSEEAIALNNLGEVAFLQEDFPAAQAYLEEAIQIERELNIRYFEAHTLTKYGEALVALGNLEAAEESFRRVLELRESLGQIYLVVSPRLRLASVALHRENRIEAIDQVALILESFDQHPPDGFEDPVSLYWDCYSLLNSLGDPRSEEMLTRARAYLEAQAARIPDPESRQSFLDNVPVNRKILNHSG